MSDIAFQNFISLILDRNENDNIQAIKEMVEQSTPDNFIQKIRSYEGEFSWDQSVRLASAIAKCSEIFPDKTHDIFLMGYGTPNSQAAIFISQLIKIHKEKVQALELAKKIIINSTSFDFAFELIRWLSGSADEKDNIFTTEQMEEIEYTFFERAMSEANSTPLFKKFPDRSVYLYKIWNRKNKDELNEHIENLFRTDKTNCVELLNALTPIMRSSAYKEPYKSNFSKDRYDFVISIFDKELFKKYIFMNFTEEEINDPNINWEEHRGEYQSDLNIVRQFMHWYNQDKRVYGNSPAISSLH